MAGEGILWPHIENAQKEKRQIVIFSNGERRQGFVVRAYQGLVILEVKTEVTGKLNSQYIKIPVSKIDFIEDTIGAL